MSYSLSLVLIRCHSTYQCICFCCPSKCNTTGKDRIIFVTKEDHATPSSAELVEEDPDDPYEERGEEQ